MCVAEPALTPCTLAIAGLCVELIVEDSALDQAIRERYVAFGAMRPAQTRACVRAAGRPCLTIEAEVGVGRGRLTLPVPSGRGVIEVAAGRAVFEPHGRPEVDDLDYFVRVVVALLAFDSGGVLLHAAGVVRRGGAHVFVGRSGSGKTTVARLAGDHRVLNDDLLVVLPAVAGWVAHATPFSNPTQVLPVGAIEAPIEGLYTLTQDHDVYLAPLPASQALAALVANAPVVNADPYRAPALVARLSALVGAVPVGNLHFRPDPSFWDVIDATSARATTPPSAAPA